MSQTIPISVDDSVHNEKAHWDSALIRTFIEICVERVKAGDRPNNFFTREGWKKIIAEFKEKTGRSYDQPKLKNKWDNLRKDWRIWEKLRKEETGAGWDHDRNTIRADNEWWERMIKEDKNYKKFRHQGLENTDLLEFLFAGQGATGANAMNPSADDPIDLDPPPHRISGSSGYDDYIPFESDADFHIEDEKSSSDDPAPTQTTRQRTNTPAPQTSRKRKGKDECSELSQSLNRIADVYHRRHVSEKGNDDEKKDMKEAIRMLKAIPEIRDDYGPLRSFAMCLMENKASRDFFICLDDADWQLEWIKKRYIDANGGSADGF